jgi:hypothetical protein
LLAEYALWTEKTLNPLVSLYTLLTLWSKWALSAGQTRVSLSACGARRTLFDQLLGLSTKASQIVCLSLYSTCSGHLLRQSELLGSFTSSLLLRIPTLDEKNPSNGADEQCSKNPDAISVLVIAVSLVKIRVVGL